MKMEFHSTNYNTYEAQNFIEKSTPGPKHTEMFQKFSIIKTEVINSIILNHI